MLTTNHRSPIRAAADKIAERLAVARRHGRGDVIDLRDPVWEYDDTEIVYGSDRADDAAAIQRLLVGRVTAGWDVDDVDTGADRCHFVFKRPLA